MHRIVWGAVYRSSVILLILRGRQQAVLHQPSCAPGPRRQQKRCRLGTAGADGPMTDVGTCRHGIHRPQRPCLLLVRARSPISSAPPDSVSGLTAAAGSGCASSCMYRGWYQGTLRRPGLATAICTTTDTSRCRKTATGTDRPVQLFERRFAGWCRYSRIKRGPAAARVWGVLAVLRQRQQLPEGRKDVPAPDIAARGP